MHPELNQEIAILDIKGKKEYNNWKNLFEQFGLQVFYICDFDNVFSLQLESGNTLINSSVQSEIRQSLSNKPRTRDFINPIKSLYSNIEKEIEALYPNRIFILKQGEIEDYIGNPDAKMEDFIDFCETKLEGWLKAPDQFSEELIAIMKKIIEA